MEYSEMNEQQKALTIAAKWFTVLVTPYLKDLGLETDVSNTDDDTLAIIYCAEIGALDKHKLNDISLTFARGALHCYVDQYMRLREGILDH
ncbi:hypothetical protein ACFP1L_09190 [Lactiplantibacillus nangangensis]|uniref:Uncharacterized protein n=1 Tax=Lactiplantibacillus nangangensis TaxID=2559917 RepID=A0ABW1SLC7_9LACO|nr:hypothetical protein [Lactiplantibacillus nangangensis]